MVYTFLALSGKQHSANDGDKCLRIWKPINFWGIKQDCNHSINFLLICVFTVVRPSNTNLRAMRCPDEQNTAQASVHRTQHEVLPTNKLTHNPRAQHPIRPAIIVGCGSFNPPTVMHMRMFELANDELVKVSLRRGRIFAALASIKPCTSSARSASQRSNHCF